MSTTRPRTLEQTRLASNARARGLVSSRRSGRRVDAHVVAPRENLRDVVAACWSGAWDLRGQEPHVTQLLADPCVHIVFEQGSAGSDSRVVGVWTRLWQRELSGRGCVRGVKLRAGAVRAFIDVPAFRISNRIVPLHTLFEDVVRIHRDVLAPADDAEGFEAFEQWLCARRLRSHENDVRLAMQAVQCIVDDPQIRSVDRLARVVGLGPRSLQRLFREHVGGSPKWAIRRHRLQEVALRLERGEVDSLAALAADLGYADQAHLARDFKNAVGKAPTAFAIDVHR